MKSMFDEKYLKTSLEILKDDVKDLSVWSVNNKDIYIDEIKKIETNIKLLEMKIKAKGAVIT